MRSIGLPELLVIAAIFVLLFGGKRFKEFGTGMGDAIREWKRAFSAGEDLKKTMKDDFENDPAWRALRDKRDWAGLQDYERRRSRPN